jgi:fructan beta-fructosidase
MRRAILAVVLISMSFSVTKADEPPVTRPVYHFTPPKNFINDPNGLVFLDGEYHLFYQHNPEGDRWGHMSWGHATSRDLVHWQHLPIALREENGIMIFSGSAVSDARNTSGLGTKDAPPLIAVYTGDGQKKQTQNLASSTDRGRTWAKFAGNPVLDLNSNSFRDPKVFWHKPTSRWIMATVLADERRVRIWGSSDLKKWEKLSDFGPAGSVQGVWECPELFEAPVEDGVQGESRWVLKVDVNAGAPFGGSGGQYFVGRFDGKEFRPEGDTRKTPLWIDFGKDFYASQCWNDTPTGGWPVWIAWMNNWQYANDIPTSPWRGAMTVPRSVAFRKTAVGLRLVQKPVGAIALLRGEKHRIENRIIAEGETKLEVDGIEGTSLDILAEFAARESDSFGLKVRRGENEETLIGVDVRAGTVFIDRSSSGAVNFSRDFPGRHSCRLTSTDGSIRLHVLVDATSVEVFADDGQAVLTDQIFPSATSRGVSLFAIGSPARLRFLEAWELRP